MPNRLRCLSEVEPRSVEWFWPRRIPLGGITVLEGKPGISKSTVTYDLAARVTTGRAKPNCHGNPRPGSVILLQAEDDADTTIRPRLEAMGADLERVLVLDKRMLSENPIIFPQDTEAIATAINDAKARLVVIDPIDPFIAGSMNNSQSVRKCLGPLSAVAARTQTAVVLVRHLTKHSKGADVLYQGAGSIGIISLARSALHVAEDPEDFSRRLLVHIKSNLGSLASTLSFMPVVRNGGVAIDWLGTSSYSAKQLQESSSPRDRPALEEAKFLLFSLLALGPLAANDVIQFAAESGVSNRTLRRAKVELDVVSKRKGFGFSSRFEWELSEENRFVQQFSEAEERRKLDEEDGTDEP